MEYAIIALALLFFGGHALQWFFTKTKIPDLLILIGIGYLVGPVMGWVDKSDLGQVGELVATLALIVILYEAGLQLSTKDLKESWIPSLLITTVNFFAICIVAALLAMPLLGFPYALLAALGVGSTSSAIVIPMVKFLSLEQKTKTILSLESAFTDILAIVLFLVVLDGIIAGKMDAISILVNIGPKTFISVGVGLLLAFAWASIKKYATHYTQMRFAGEAWALLSYGIATLLSLNGALCVLSLGFTLANLNLLPRWMTKLFSAVPVTSEEMSLRNTHSYFYFRYKIDWCEIVIPG